MTRRIMVAKSTDAPANGELPVYDSTTDSWSNTDSPSVANLTTAQGIVFPATQNPSAGANVLDDYEENTWTPAWAGSSGAAANVTAHGAYTKFGSWVTLSGLIVASVGTLAGNLSITGLPFTPATTIDHWAGTVAYVSGFVSLVGYTPGIYINASVGSIILVANKDWVSSAVGTNQLPASPTTATIIFSVGYRATN